MYKNWMTKQNASPASIFRENSRRTDWYLTVSCPPFGFFLTFRTAMTGAFSLVEWSKQNSTILLDKNTIYSYYQREILSLVKKMIFLVLFLTNLTKTWRYRFFYKIMWASVSDFGVSELRTLVVKVTIMAAARGKNGEREEKKKKK